MPMLLIFLILVGFQTVSGGRHKQKKEKKAEDDPYITSDTYPDPHRTPGHIFPDITLEEVCKGGYSRRTRRVSMDIKRAVKISYGIAPDDSNYSIDHFIPLSLGGSNEVTNLWPQKIAGIVYGAAQKAQSDYYLYKEVCEGRLSLGEAQERIRENWVITFKECCSHAALRHMPIVLPQAEETEEDDQWMIFAQ